MIGGLKVIPLQEGNFRSQDNNKLKTINHKHTMHGDQPE
jgi:hypothetical protein